MVWVSPCKKSEMVFSSCVIYSGRGTNHMGPPLSKTGAYMHDMVHKEL